MQAARDVRGREQLLWGCDRGDSNEQKLGLTVGKWIEVKSAKGHGVSYGRRIKRAGTERGCHVCSISLCVSFLTANNKGNHTGWQYATTGNIAEGD